MLKKEGLVKSKDGVVKDDGTHAPDTANPQNNSND